MPASGKSGSTSTKSVVTAIVFNGAVFLITIAAFLFLRSRQPRIYQPRATVATVDANNRPRPLKKGFTQWAKDLLTRKDSEILRDAGLDGYFFLRYLRIGTIICLVGVIVLYPVLLAVNATGGNGAGGLDQLAFGNVENSNRYYAHVFLSWIFFGFIVFTLYREMCYYTGVRQAVLTSPHYSNLVSSRSILIGTVPKDYLSVDAVASLFEGVKYVWINRNYSDLDKKVKERNKLAMKVENAEVKYVKTAVKNRLKSEKKKNATPIDGQDIKEYVPDKKRPTHKLKPLVGKKVDTIDYGREKIPELTTEIMEMQQAHENFAPLNSAFVTFTTQEHAEFAYQTLAHHQAFQMSPRYIGVRPDDVYWPNLRLLWWERLIRSLVALGAICALVIFWAIPVAFVGAISNLDSLTNKLPWLNFIYNLPEQLLGLITSMLPTILLAVLMMLLPIFIRLMAKMAGRPTLTLVEYYTQNAYFAFQVVQVFLVTTISSAAASVVTQIIAEPTSVMSMLATNLPKASNFYISYFLLQGLTACGTMLLQIVGLIVFHVLRALLDGTPRKIWTRWNVLGGAGWGMIFPVYANLLTIAITYSLISPILLIFAALTFGLLYFGYLHNLMFITLPTDGRGIYYVRAIYQTFTGLYLAEICLIGLFAVAKAWGPVVLEALMIAVTVFVQINMQNAFEPLQSNLPRDLLRAGAGNGSNGITTTTNSSSSPGDEKNAASLAATNTATTDDGKRPSGTTADGDEDEAERGFGSKVNPGKQMGALARYFKPHQFLTPEVLARDFLPPSYQEYPPPMSAEEESHAFSHPAVTATNPVVWIPRDPWGLSAAQTEQLRANDVNAFDNGSWFEIDDKKKKSKIMTTDDVNDVPIWAKPIKY